MKLLSVNIGKAEKIGGPSTAKYYAGKSGINKRAVDSPVFVGKLGLTGDEICNTKYHGGIDQAVYLYGRDDYTYFEDLLQIDCPHGLFGENFTLDNLKSGHVNVGDQYQFGKLILEVTSPRIPCATFSARMDNKNFTKIFMKANRPGVYCRVLNEDIVQSGINGTIKPYDGPSVRLTELFESYPYKKISEEQRARFLSVPIHWKARAFFNGERDTPS